MQAHPFEDREQRLLGDEDHEAERDERHHHAAVLERLEVGLVAEPHRRHGETHERLVQGVRPRGALVAQKGREQHAARQPEGQQQTADPGRRRHAAPAPQLEGEHRAEGEEGEALPVAPVGRRRAQQPEGGERRHRQPSQPSHRPVQQRADRDAQDERLQEPERVRHRRPQELFEQAPDAELPEEVLAEVQLRAGQGLEEHVERQTQRAPEQKRHDDRAEPAAELARVVGPVRRQVAEEEEAGDGEERRCRPAAQRLRDQILDEADHAGRAGHAGGVLGRDEAAAHVVGVHADDGDHREQRHHAQLRAEVPRDGIGRQH